VRRRQRHCRSPGRPFADGLVQVGAGRDGPLLSPLLRRKSKCDDARHSCFFSFSPLRSKLKGKLRKTKRESGGFVRSLLHRVCGGGGCVTQLRAGLRISRLPMGSFRAVSKVTARPHLRDLATFPFTFIRWHYNPRHADIFI
jgi:hypothetical protein